MIDNSFLVFYTRIYDKERRLQYAYFIIVSFLHESGRE